MANPRAHCLCGRVQLEPTQPPLRAGHCHCANCRRAQGAGSWTWVTFSGEAVRIAAGADELRHYRSDTDATRGFCGHCGTTITYESPRWPGHLDISAACFDQPPTLPDRHLYADRAPAWAPILDTLPQFGGASGSEPLSA
ncbi:MAG: GFA family protein [Planctomycetota bacterium]